MGLIRIKGGTAGIGEYLRTGNKAGRNYSRDELDHRRVVFGETVLLDQIVDGMDLADDVERYLHITFGCAEDYVPEETQDGIAWEFKEFIGSAWPDDALFSHGEWHIPKIKSYIDQSGEEIVRLPHFHLAIPKENLETGQKADPVGMLSARFGTGTSTQELIDSFQEYLNLKYGLASPKDPEHQRLSPESPIMRWADKPLSAKDLKEELTREITSEVIESDVTTDEAYEAFLVDKYGNGNVEHATSKNGDYWKVRAEGSDKWTRLGDKGILLSADFIKMSREDKLALIERVKGDANKYLEPHQGGLEPSDAERLAALEEKVQYWHQVRAREIRFIHTDTKFYKEHYRFLDTAERIKVLDALSEGKRFEVGDLSIAPPTSSRLNELFHGQSAEDLQLGKMVGRGDQEAIGDMLAELTHHQSSFAKADLEAWLLRHTSTPKSYDKALEAILRSPDLVVVGGKETGTPERYTSREIFETEQELIVRARTLRGIHGDPASTKGVDTSTLNKGQAAALSALCSGRALEVVNGAAGTGKSFVLAKAREAYEAQGFEVHGAILQGKTAEDLERDSGIKSHTIASFLKQVEIGKIKVSKKTVIVVDEAGMVGSEQMNHLLGLADQGARIRLVGDAWQVQSVTFGNAFASISKETGVAALTDIMRQKTDWMRKASMALSRHDIEGGLSHYVKNGAVRFERDQMDAIDAIAREVRADRKAGFGGTAIVIAKTNAERRELNDLIRRDLIEDGEVDSQEIEVITPDGKLNVAIGESLMFTSPDKQIGVKNGTAGKVVDINESMEGMVVTVDVGDRHVRFLSTNETKVDYGYAVTINKSQGMTVDRAYVLSHKSMTANDAYVAATRHKSELKIFGSEEHYTPRAVVREQVAAAQKGGEAPRATHAQLAGELVRKAGQSSVKQFTGHETETKVDQTVVSRLLEEQNMKSLMAKEANRTAIAQLNAELEAKRLLTRLEADKGLQFDKYQVNADNTIQAGSRKLTCVEFATKEMSMNFKDETMPYLRDTYRQQLQNAYMDRQPKTSEAERREFAEWNRRQQTEFRRLSTELSKAAREEKNAARASGDAERLAAVQQRLDQDRAALSAQYNKPNRELFNQFRQERAEHLAAAQKSHAPAPEARATGAQDAPERENAKVDMPKAAVPQGNRPEAPQKSKPTSIKDAMSQAKRETGENRLDKAKKALQEKTGKDEKKPSERAHEADKPVNVEKGQEPEPEH